MRLRAKAHLLRRGCCLAALMFVTSWHVEIWVSTDTGTLSLPSHHTDRSTPRQLSSMEAVVVCIDNSEWTRNGDYAPNRFQAQADAVNLLAGAKTEANSENTVGVITMSGKSPKVLVTLTTDLGKILNSVQASNYFELSLLVPNLWCISKIKYRIIPSISANDSHASEFLRSFHCREWRLRVPPT